MSALESPSLRVSRQARWLGNMVTRHPHTWIALGNLESRLLASDLGDIPLSMPIYICGLARSGSTVLLEALASHSETASHRYQDFPFLFTPYWWNTLLKFQPFRDKTLRERAHGDGILINSESPEAMEEMLWMAFFSELHRAGHNRFLDGSASNPGFEDFYRLHIRKLLLARKATRYVAKGNYNIARLAYLRRLFPDARFIIPIRDPVTHIESLIRQHRRFSDAGHADPNVPLHMSQVGHFEFGLNRQAIHLGEIQVSQAIEQAWQSGDDVRGFALYWNMLYRFIYDQLIANPPLGRSVLVVPFERLCAAPHETLLHLFEHSRLPAEPAFINERASRVRTPDYYASALSPAEVETIRAITGATAQLFGYD